MTPKTIYPGSQFNHQWHGNHKDCIESINPTTTKSIATYALCPEDKMTAMIQHAKETQKIWQQIPAPKRAVLVREIGEAFRTQKEELAALLTEEVGKIIEDARGEVQEVIDMAEFAVGQSRMLYGKTIASERENHRLYEQWHPYGVCGIITAFNFPMAVWAWNAFLALITGNCIIWKPSLKTPKCAYYIQNLCDQIIKKHKFPPVCSLLLCSNPDTMRFVDHPDVDIISFTGSCQVGQKIATRVQARFGKIILELGGNNAIIIDTDANLDLAIPAIVFGAVGTAGQRCTTTRRVFVHQSQLQQIREQLCHAYEQITIGDPAHASTLMGPLIDQAAVTDYLKAITAIQQQGGSILTGGKKHPLGGNFVYPTLAYVPHNIPIVQAETFSPICYLIAYQTLTEAITAQNNVSQGLSSALFTNRLSAAEQFLSHAGSDCGLANINIGTSGAEIGGAFGGEKHTGGGREAGSDAWQSYMRRQTNTINWGKTLPLAQGIQFNISNKK